MNEKLKVSVARVLLAFMLNPVALLGSAYGADTDVYQGLTGGGGSGSGSGGTVKTNVLLLLDTSNSMNIPEPWKEYDPNTYDSHAEYLWNSPAYINTISTNVASGSGSNWSSNLSNVTTAGTSGTTFYPSGSTSGTTRMQYDSGWFFGGLVNDSTTNTKSQALKDAALAYANGTNSGNAAHTSPAVTDGGPRYRYRNYAYSHESWYHGFHAWIYWTPASSTEADDRLRSFSTNKFSGLPVISSTGHVTTAGAAPPIWRGGIYYGEAQSFEQYNLCESSKPALVPSTVYAPDKRFLRGPGKLLGQRWKRWETFSGLNTSKFSQYPGSDAIGRDNWVQGYLDGHRDNGSGLEGGPIQLRVRGGSIDYSYPNTLAPISDTDSYSRWADLKPDWGSIYYDSNLSTLSNTNWLNELNAIRSSNGFTTAMSTPQLAQRAFVKEIPKPDYVDYQTSLTVSAIPGTTVTKTRSCTHTGYSQTTDAAGVTHRYGGSCVAGATSSCDNQPYLCNQVPEPASCGTTPSQFPNESFTTVQQNACSWASSWTNYCSWNGSRTATWIPGTAGVSCSWSGRTGSLVGYVPPSETSPGNPGYYQYCGGTCQQSNGSTSGCTGESGCTVGSMGSCSGSSGTSGYYRYCDGTCTLGGSTAPCTATSSCVDGWEGQCDGSQPVYVGPCSGTKVTWSGGSNSTSAASCVSNASGTCYNPNSSTVSTCQGALSTPCTGCETTYSSQYFPGSPPETYTVYNRYSAVPDYYMYHECLADDGTSGNPGSTQYLRKPKASGMSNWIQPYTTGYVSSASAGFTAANEPQVNLYSSNYLNFKFGAKACRDSSGNLITSTGSLGSAASCKPLARKTRIQIAKDVLTDLVTNLLAANAPVRLGLMAFNPVQQVGSAYKTKGAYLVKAVKDLDASSAGELISAINQLDASAHTPLTESLYESYLYYKGSGIYFGDDADGSPLRGVARDTSSAAMSNTSTYKSPILEGCQASWVILVSDGAPEEDSDANSLITALPSTTAASISPQLVDPTTGNPYGPPDPSWSPGYVWLDELAQYMAKVDARSDLAGTQTVKLSTISFAGANAPVLSAAAEAGGGTAYSASDQVSLLQSLTDAVNQASQWQPIGAPTTVYQPSAGASDTVFVPMYAPTPKVTWDGTVKKFKYGFGEAVCGPASCGNPEVCMIGQTELDAVCKKNVEVVELDTVLNLSMVKIRPEAVSFWGSSTEADGAFGSKGGTGKIIKTQNFASRVMKTALTTGATISNLDVSIANKDLLITDVGISSARREELIHYARGGDGSGANAWRLWPSFDNVHSRPVTDDNGTPTDLTDDTLYYVTSDGVLHAVNTETGVENWAFMIEETFPQLTPIRDNPSGPHIQVAGGTPVVLKTTANKKLVVFGMRRGGRAYYAIDVTSGTPSLAWKVAHNRFCNSSGCQATSAASTDSVNYAELGQTWSTPVVGKIRGVSEPVLVFGGGYDPDADNNGHDHDTYGRAVFVVNGATGEKIKQFNLRDDLSEAGNGYAVPSDVLALDTNGDAQGALDRAYVGDLGGNLWRLDLDDRSTSNAASGWSKVKLAKLKGVRSNNDNLNHRLKMFNRPTMAPVNYDGKIFDAIFVGGGDNQKPTDTANSGVIYMVKDKAVASVAVQLPTGDIPEAGQNCGSYPCFVDMTGATTANALDLGLNGEASPTISRRDALKNTTGGWMVRLDDGEKVVTDCQVFGGNLYLGTFYPSQSSGGGASACAASGGYGRQMVMSAMSGMPLFNGSTLVNSAGNGRAYAGVYGLGRALVPVGTKGRPPKLGAPGTTAQQAGTQGGIRVYWYSMPER